MKSKDIRIGIIGCGWIIEHAHIPAFNKIQSGIVSSLYDLDIRRALRLGKMFDIHKAHDDIDAFFNSGIDAVVIATPNNTHFTYSLKALENGINVLCEKPIALYAHEVRRLISVENEKDVRFVPGFVNRFRYDVMKLYEYVKSGKIGEVLKVEGGWLRRSGIPRPGTWFTNKELSGGGVLIDLGSHILDICLMMLDGKKPISMALETLKSGNKANVSDAQWFKGDYRKELSIDVEDTALVRAEFEGNVQLDVRLSWATDIEGDCTYFKISGTEGCIKLKTLFGFSNERLWKDDTLVIRDNSGSIHNIVFEKSSNNTMKAFSEMAKFFVDAINGKRSDYLTGMDGLRTVEFIEKLYSSELDGQEGLRNLYPEGL